MTEKPRDRGRSRVGNSGIKTNDILDAVAEKSGDIYNQSKARVDELAVRRLYLDHGYPDATVSSSTAPGRSKGEVLLTFSVNEGLQVAVREIRFSGNTAVSSQTLKGKLSLKESGFLQNGSFQESKLEDDKKTIVEYYQSRGYVDAAVEDVVRSYEKDPKTSKNWLVLTIAIKEGKQWLFGGMSFDGNAIFSTEKLATYFSREAWLHPQLYEAQARESPRSTTCTTSPATSSTRSPSTRAGTRQSSLSPTRSTSASRTGPHREHHLQGEQEDQGLRPLPRTAPRGRRRLLQGQDHGWPAHVNAAMRVFETEDTRDFQAYIDVHRVFSYREKWPLCEAALREHGPMTTKELALHLMAAKGLDTDDNVLARTIANRLIHSLRMQADAQSRCGRRKAKGCLRLAAGRTQTMKLVVAGKITPPRFIGCYAARGRRRNASS